MDDTIRRIVGFIREIGLDIKRESLSEDTFLPGVTIRRGGLEYDPARLRYPGDLLHEAGHLAVIPGEERARLSGSVGEDPGSEMAAIAWSYAAAVRLDLAPEVVFHRDGYKGESQNIIENFTSGNYFGVPILEWRGLTSTREDADVRYPNMARWTCQ